jgi:hypothetical protein
MSTETAMRPDERVLCSHLAQGAFRSGQARGRWRLVSVVWPHVFIAVTAAERPSSPPEYLFRFDCTNYPADPTNACPWDETTNSPLSKGNWPGGTERVAYAFNPDWQNGTALYLPCDRVSIQGHDAWRTQHPHLLWTPDKTICFYLGVIYDLLHSPHYTGMRSPGA